MKDEFKTLTKFDAGEGREGFFIRCLLWKSRYRKNFALAREHSHRAGIRPAKLRRKKSPAQRCRYTCELERKIACPMPKFLSLSRALCFRISPALPLVVDLAAMRSAVKKLGGDPKIIEPLVPVDLVVDHSVQVDFFGSARALQLNLEMEFKRNRERYQFLKWGQQAFKTFQLIPPGIGIVHQVNLEYLAKGVPLSQPSTLNSQLFFPDTLVGTDSHTTMINDSAWLAGALAESKQKLACLVSRFIF